ncbi:MAG TPA: tail fiber protein [Candidatus Angelobacter sp.]
MGSPFVGEIRIFAGNFAPTGWMFCDGSLLQISQNTVLFDLLGTTYGGDGVNTFALPDLQGRVPVHQGTDSFGNTFVMGQKAGEETVTLTTSQIPAHSHPALANSGPGNQQSPANGVWATPSTGTIYSNVAPSLTMAPAAIGLAGGSQPHDNMVPFLAVSFIISLFGIFPSQT